MTGIVRGAYLYAAAAHGAIGQVRKYDREPYINHPHRVATLVSSIPDISQHVIAAAFLHDVVEDTQVTIQQIGQHFGLYIATLVHELTDTATAADGNRAVRKQMALNRLAGASAQAQTIKLADLIDNTSSIVKHDPKFAVTYLQEKAALLLVLTKGDEGLWAVAQKQLTAALKELDLC